MVVHSTNSFYFCIFSELFSFPGPHEFEDVFAYYLARNNCQLQGTKCKVCSQHLGANQPYCQRCSPAKINQKDHHKHKIDHKFEMLKTANSHIYSEAVLLVACGGNYKDILRGYLSIPKFIYPPLATGIFQSVQSVTVQPVTLKTILKNAMRLNTTIVPSQF